MNIVCATDDNFVQHCSIMLVSLLCNNKDVRIFILTEGLRTENEKIIQDEVRAYGGSVEFCIVDPAIVEKFPMPSARGLSHISRATYYRLLISDLLPVAVEKALYLDCDIIVNSSLDELWATDLEGYALAAVPQIGYGFEAERMGYPIEYGYFNAGVTLMNLRYFRENDVCRQLIEYIRDHYDKIKFHDQDTLNAVLYDKTLHLMPQWNMTALVYTAGLNQRGDKSGGKVINAYEREKKNAAEHKWKPCVLHYVSKPKPWSRNCVHPLYHLYYDYAARTIHYNHLKPQSDWSRGLAILKNNLRGWGSVLKQALHKTDPSRL